MNLIQTSVLADISQVAYAYRLLTSRDQRTQKLAYDSMKEVAEKRLKKELSMEEIADFYNGCKSPDVPSEANDIPSCWTRLRGATQRLKSKMIIKWFVDAHKKIYNLQINKAYATRFGVEFQLRDATRSFHKKRMLEKKEQGRVYTVTSRNQVSNHFYRNGNFTRITEWNFIHRARLNLVPLNGGTKRHFLKDQSCRKCRYPCETLFHVLNRCEPNFSKITERHDAIIKRLMGGFKKKRTQEILLDQIIPDTASTLRPDITIIDKENKEVIIIDVTVPFENFPKAFINARERKMEKYLPIKQELEDQGYSVFLDAFIIGSLGGYDNQNYKSISALGISKRYAILMKKLMVTETIKWSREIYMDHVCCKRKNAPPQ
uniref:Reverse transcriptase n=1 Tax=Panagrolaimus davidi TaxID=227884 RepID=A0A914Q0J1_9BILA